MYDLLNTFSIEGLKCVHSSKDIVNALYLTSILAMVIIVVSLT